MIRRALKGIDWGIVAVVIPLMLGGIATMTSFGGEASFFGKQLLWIIVGLIIMFSYSSKKRCFRLLMTSRSFDGFPRISIIRAS